jgi:hypothetical protein
MALSLLLAGLRKGRGAVITRMAWGREFAIEEMLQTRREERTYRYLE